MHGWGFYSRSASYKKYEVNEHFDWTINDWDCPKHGINPCSPFLKVP